MKVRWILTNELRWQERSEPYLGDTHTFWIVKVLQQKYVSRLGAIKWVDVLTVTK